MPRLVLTMLLGSAIVLFVRFATDGGREMRNGMGRNFQLDWECEVCGSVWMSRGSAVRCAEEDYSAAAEAANPLRDPDFGFGGGTYQVHVDHPDGDAVFTVEARSEAAALGAGERLGVRRIGEGAVATWVCAL